MSRRPSTSVLPSRSAWAVGVGRVLFSCCRVWWVGAHAGGIGMFRRGMRDKCETSREGVGLGWEAATFGLQSSTFRRGFGARYSLYPL